MLILESQNIRELRTQIMKNQTQINHIDLKVLIYILFL
jgi:hypothetical protein